MKSNDTKHLHSKQLLILYSYFANSIDIQFNIILQMYNKYYLMQDILKNPVISNFLEKFKHEDYISTIKDLILIGIDVVLTRLQKQLKVQDIKTIVQQKFGVNKTVNQKPQRQQNVVMKQIDLIKSEIQKINKRFSLNTHIQNNSSQYVKAIPTNQHKYYNEEVTFNNKNDFIKNYGSIKERKKNDITPKVTQVYPQFDKPPDIKKINRHHLDDHQLKEILTYSNIDQNGQINKKEKIQKRPTNQKHEKDVVTHQINIRKKDHVSKIEELKTEKSLEYIRLKKSPQIKRETSGPKYLRNVESKIKDIIKNDKVKVKHSGVFIKDLDEQNQFLKSKLIENKNEAEKYITNSNKKYQQELQMHYQPIKHSNKKKTDENNENDHHKPDSNIQKANKFLSSPIGQKYCKKVENQLDKSQESESQSSQFSSFNPDLKPQALKLQSSSSFSIQNYETKKVRKNAGKISRKRDQENH